MAARVTKEQKSWADGRRGEDVTVGLDGSITGWDLSPDDTGDPTHAPLLRFTVSGPNGVATFDAQAPLSDADRDAIRQEREKRDADARAEAEAEEAARQKAERDAFEAAVAAGVDRRLKELGMTPPAAGKPER